MVFGLKRFVRLGHRSGNHTAARCDPFLRFKLLEADAADGEVQVRTATMPDVTNPVWPTCPGMRVPPGTPRPLLLLIRLWDEAHPQGTEPLASAHVRLGEAIEGGIETVLAGRLGQKDVKVTFHFNFEDSVTGVVETNHGSPPSQSKRSAN